MSIKSLLQLILFLLIVLIIGGIYYLYFYSGPIDNKNVINKNIEKLSNKKLVEQNNFDQEILEVITEEQRKLNKEKNDLNKNENNLSQKNTDNNKLVKEKEILKENENLKKKELDKEIKNLTKEIEYITTNKNGDKFKIISKYGKTNIENTNILDLETVKGTISSADRSTIYISSELANYNYTNQNSKFYKNVNIKYDNKIITCDNLDLIISENIAVAYSNVIVKDDVSVMSAQKITLDILTKDIKINSDEKIKINTTTK